MINRGIDHVDGGKVFLRPKLTELIVPEKMPGVKVAVGRIKKAIEAKEKITIYGDYYVDGICQGKIWSLPHGDTRIGYDHCARIEVIKLLHYLIGKDIRIRIFYGNNITGETYVCTDKQSRSGRYFLNFVI